MPKYAIFKTEFGLSASLYADSPNEIKRFPYIKDEYLPVIINDVGGYTSFDPKYYENFLYIKEVKENEEPLTREERYPKNNDNFYFGFINSEGDTFTCGFEDHTDCASAICREQGIETYNAESTLEELGWIKISRKVPYTADNLKVRAAYIPPGYFKRLTNKQCEILIDQKLDIDTTIAAAIYVSRFTK